MVRGCFITKLSSAAGLTGEGLAPYYRRKSGHPIAERPSQRSMAHTTTTVVRRAV